MAGQNTFFFTESLLSCTKNATCLINNAVIIKNFKEKDYDVYSLTLQYSSLHCFKQKKMLILTKCPDIFHDVATVNL